MAAEYYRPVQVRMPENVGGNYDFELLTPIVADNYEFVPGMKFNTGDLDDEGLATINLPVPDNTDTNSALYRFQGPDKSRILPLSYGDGNIVELATLLNIVGSQIVPPLVGVSPVLAEALQDWYTAVAGAVDGNLLASVSDAIADSGVAATAVGNATQIQGRNVASDAPSNGQPLIWDSGQNRWEPGFNWLGDISNTLIVDPAGNAPSSYATLGAAIQAATAGQVIRVFGTTTETEDLFIDGVTYPAVALTIYLEPGAIVDFGASYAYYLMSSAANHRIYGPGEIRNAVASVGALSLFDGTFEVRGATIRNTASNGRALDLQPGGATAIVKMYGTVLVASGTNGTCVQKSSAAMGTGTVFVYVTAHGTRSVLSATSWTSAPFYHCALNGTVTNMTANAGTANGTNVVF